MDKKSFGKQLQRYRERAGYSQEALAELVECSTIFISYIERGEKSPSLDTLIKRHLFNSCKSRLFKGFWDIFGT